MRSEGLGWKLEWTKWLKKQLQETVHNTLLLGCFYLLYMLYSDRGSTVVKALCYKSEGRWFDPSWCQWIFRWHKMLPIALWPWGLSNRNEYQEHFLGVKAAGAWGWSYHNPVPLLRNLGTLTSWNPLGHCRPVMWLLYLLLPSLNAAGRREDLSNVIFRINLLWNKYRQRMWQASSFYDCICTVHVVRSLNF